MRNRLKLFTFVPSVLAALKQLQAAHAALLARQSIIDRQQARIAERLATIDDRLSALDRALVNVATESLLTVPSSRTQTRACAPALVRSVRRIDKAG